ncbi:SacI domain-containing protein [Westerdykella ornata]|uniref:SacI domain-containing protein n=1 Tax=Westerdykella ornata TaxID=318751 RepID=A0A6A6JJU3_WESOR|nr:SacI domain-containing protein [Westerdykella ornata]KAF2276871.1 SacI domain-containing protein [Westerdykella ornata]
MPGLVRKLLIFAAVDGLILQPAPPRNHTPTTQQAIKIDYRGNVKPLLKDRREEDTAPVALEAHGIIGLLKVATSFFLISISGREPVAQICGNSIFKITDVALIPLSSQSDAQLALTAAREHVQRHIKTPSEDEDASESETDDNDTLSVTDSIVDAGPDTTLEQVKDPVTEQKAPVERKTSVAEDVIQKKGVYGRFAERWFSKKGWSTESRRVQGLSSEEDLATTNNQIGVESSVPEESTRSVTDSNDNGIPTSGENEREAVSPEEIPKALEGQKDSTTMALLPKILRTTKLYFGSGNFFFSYDYDLSRGIGQQQADSNLPLFLQSDPLYFWNQHILSPFIDAGQHNFVLPVIQGFVGQRAFSIKPPESGSSSAIIDPASTADDIQLQSWREQISDSNSDSGRPDPKVGSSSGKDFLLTLISRRSVKRAGLRYLRRGVDDEGNAANSVETEQILSPATWETSRDKIFSFTQYRGSIPLFFSQSPYSLKPQVNTWGTTETNAKAFKRHFTDLGARYGSIYCASLVDKHGTEAKIGEAYEQHVKSLNRDGGLDGQGKELGFEWFDFHYVCRGMRFENVARLMATLGPFLKSTGWTEISDDAIVKTQTGILRTNCMDCLDRTNVVQSACARTALEAQLSEEGFHIDLQHDPSTNWFNTLWADNGDAISRQYAGTAALKGDFTRTRKRQITGALTDFGLTLTRYYNNIVNDFFTQAVIDYILGRATDAIFAEFEADMKSSDYFIDVRKVREAAIERCEGIVIEDKDEDLIAGWTLSVPTSANKLKTATFEEAVLLLTNKAVYFCRLDWGTEKVREFERIDLDLIDGIARGVYITSTLAQRHTDAKKNVGFILRYRVHPGSELVRRNTRSIDSRERGEPQDKPAKGQTEDTGRFLAFKALPPCSSVTSADSNEIQDDEMSVVKDICEEIARVANKARRHGPASGESIVSQDNGDTTATIHELVVEEKDIISLVDAKKSTGYLEQLGYSLKKLVWA